MSFLNQEQVDRVKEFQIFLEKWNKKINLVADGEDIWNRHILDSAQILNIVPHETGILDVGSGGGFPGIIISICGIKNIHLVESDIRKCQFLEEVKIKFNLDCSIHNSRIEELEIDNINAITTRAFSTVENIFQYTSKIRNFETEYFLFKTNFSNKELDKANKKWSFHVEQLPSITSPTHVILRVSGVTLNEKQKR